MTERGTPSLPRSAGSGLAWRVSQSSRGTKRSEAAHVRLDVPPAPHQLQEKGHTAAKSTVDQASNLPTGSLIALRRHRWSEVMQAKFAALNQLDLVPPSQRSERASSQQHANARPLLNFWQTGNTLSQMEVTRPHGTKLNKTTVSPRRAGARLSVSLTPRAESAATAPQRARHFPSPPMLPLPPLTSPRRASPRRLKHRSQPSPPLARPATGAGVRDTGATTQAQQRRLREFQDVFDQAVERKQQHKLCEALFVLDKALRVAGSLHAHDVVAKVLYNMGAVNSLLGRLHAAILHLSKSAEMFEQQGDMEQQCIALGALNAAQLSAGFLAEAEASSKLWLRLSKRLSLGMQVEALRGLAKVYEHSGRYLEALEMHTTGLALAVDMKQQVEVTKAYFAMAQVYAFMSHPQHAVELLEKGAAAHAAMPSELRVQYHLQLVRLSALQHRWSASCLTPSVLSRAGSCVSEPSAVGPSTTPVFATAGRCHGGQRPARNGVGTRGDGARHIS